MSKCLYCYKELEPGEVDFHKSCCRKFFGTATAPSLDYTREEMDELAAQVIKSQTTLTGVQPKLSLNLDKHRDSRKFTIVGLWGSYIFKPQTERFAMLPENEDLTMHLAGIAKLKIVPHTLIRMKDGSIGYLTKRIDRTEKGEKIAMEDMCQLTERQTEHKYRSSYEQIGKAIRKYSAYPQLDMVNFLELVYFSWLTGNNDMHLKNFSLYSPAGEPVLTPAYDLLSAAISNPADDEELALNLNGKKKLLKDFDFVAAFRTCGVPEIVFNRIKKKYLDLLPKFEEEIQGSFLSEDLKAAYIELFHKRMKAQVNDGKAG
ncbi:MAG: HipA domain-containing protein [Bacteroidales bacterium]|nr:HipA domain-containing protein [Bacteroidales bacterium]